MKFLRLTDFQTGEENILVRNDTIVAIYPDKEGTGAYVVCTTGHSFHVREYSETVMEHVANSFDVKAETWYDVPVTKLGISAETAYRLKRHDIKTVGHLAEQSEKVLTEYGFDVTDIQQINHHLGKWELALEMTTNEVCEQYVDSSFFYEEC